MIPKNVQMPNPNPKYKPPGTPAGGRGGTLMEIEKLIEQLQKSADFEDYPVVAEFAAIIEKKYLREAATALEQLQAENDRIRRERDAAVKDIWVPRWESCKFGPGCDYISAVTGFPDCAGCGEWAWRGLKEE